MSSLNPDIWSYSTASARTRNYPRGNRGGLIYARIWLGWSGGGPETLDGPWHVRVVKANGHTLDTAGPYETWPEAAEAAERLLAEHTDEIEAAE